MGLIDSIIKGTIEVTMEAFSLLLLLIFGLGYLFIFTYWIFMW